MSESIPQGHIWQALYQFMLPTQAVKDRNVKQSSYTGQVHAVCVYSYSPQLSVHTVLYRMSVESDY